MPDYRHVVRGVTSSGQLRAGGPMARSRVARVNWLCAHRDLWMGLPSDAEDVDDLQRGRLIALGDRMVKAGLYSSRTNVKDRTWGIRVLINEARRTPA